MAQTVLADAQSLINDALFRAGEIPGASEWDAKAVDYLNREYRALCSGASEFLPEFVHDWWWMRGRGVLTILPVVTGVALMTTGSATVILSVDPGISLTGRRFKIAEHPDVFIVQAHAGTGVTLDSVYTGPSSAAASYQALKMTYTLDANAQALMSPIVSFRENPQISGMSPERMDELFPLSRLLSGVPQAFALENEGTIRFSHGGRTDGTSMRMEYSYRPQVQDLINSSSSFPLVPIQHRHVLADMILVYIYNDKNDDRMQVIGTSVRSTLGAMTADNTRRMKKIDRLAGSIQTRASNTRRNLNNALRTESGLIIG